MFALYLAGFGDELVGQRESVGTGRLRGAGALRVCLWLALERWSVAVEVGWGDVRDAPREAGVMGEVC